MTGRILLTDGRTVLGGRLHVAVIRPDGISCSQLCGTGTATEMAVPGYARQPIAFGDPVNGVSFSTIPYTFGLGVRGAMSRAICDAPADGNLLPVLPFPTPIVRGRLPEDNADLGTSGRCWR